MKALATNEIQNLNINADIAVLDHESDWFQDEPEDHEEDTLALVADVTTSSSFDDDKKLNDSDESGRPLSEDTDDPSSALGSLQKFQSVFSWLYGKILLALTLIFLFWFSYIVVICNSTYFWNPRNSAFDNPLQVYVCGPLLGTSYDSTNNGDDDKSFFWSWNLERDHMGFPMWPATVSLTALLIVIPAIFFLWPPPHNNVSSLLVQGNSSTTAAVTTTTTTTRRRRKIKTITIRRGDRSMRFWSIVLLVIPLTVVLGISLLKPIPTLSPKDAKIVENHRLYMQLLISWANPTGYAAAVSLSFFLVPVAKQSPLLALLGLSPTYAVQFHIWAGRLCGIFVTVHGILYTLLAAVKSPDAPSSSSSSSSSWQTNILYELFPMRSRCWRWQAPGGFRRPEEPTQYCYTQWRNVTGVISAMALFLVIMTSWNIIRRRCYKVFFICHIVFGSIMMIFAVLHFYWIAIYLMPGIIYYLVCNIPVLLREIIHYWRGWSCSSRGTDSASCSGGGVKLQKATIIPNSNGCFELQLATISQPRHHPAYVKLCVPEISSIWEWHPFTVAQSSQYELRLLLREFGPFTKKLRQSLQQMQQDDGNLSTCNNHLTILMDGFYDTGPDWVQEAIEFHDTSLFVVAGIGVTPVLPVVDQLWKRLSNAASGSMTSVVNIHIHWFCRDRTLVQHVQNNYLRPLFQECQSQGDGDPDALPRTIELRQSQICFTIHLTSLDDEDQEMGAGIQHTDVSIKQHKNSAMGKVPFQVATIGNKVAAAAMVCACVLHLWWFHNVTWDYRARVFVRGYSLAFVGITILLALITYEVSRRIWTTRNQGEILLPEEEDDEPDECRTALGGLDVRKAKSDAEFSAQSSSCTFALQTVMGRSRIGDYIEPIIQSPNPAVFFCGPNRLWNDLKQEVGEKKGASYCAWFKEHFEI